MQTFIILWSVGLVAWLAYVVFKLDNKVAVLKSILDIEASGHEEASTIQEPFPILGIDRK